MDWLKHIEQMQINQAITIRWKLQVSQNVMLVKNVKQTENFIEIPFLRENDCGWFNDTGLCTWPSTARSISNDTYNTGQRTGDANLNNINQREQTKDYLTSIKKR